MVKTKTLLQQEGTLEVYRLMDRLYVIQAALALPIPKKAGVYRSGGEPQPHPRTRPFDWLVTNPEVASIFETSSVGFAPAPVELKSFKEWNKAQMEKKCHTA